MNIMIANSIKVDIINKIFQRTLINEMLIDDNTQIFKNAFNHKVMSVDKINYISKNH